MRTAACLLVGVLSVVGLPRCRKSKLPSEIMGLSSKSFDGKCLELFQHTHSFECESEDFGSQVWEEVYDVPSHSSDWRDPKPRMRIAFAGAGTVCTMMKLADLVFEMEWHWEPAAEATPEEGEQFHVNVRVVQARLSSVIDPYPYQEFVYSWINAECLENATALSNKLYISSGGSVSAWSLVPTNIMSSASEGLLALSLFAFAVSSSLFLI
eukprot:Gregarina_sp_Pseudo_9__550@NODE_1354_length_1666_cov_105_838967_g1265_i0_p1_GENE_NODE_1354_length_1666_cov_105_838967_g1265_i0NODE_1354_length_1666_cov_105_838967_g1265_i0_p1_ORF_typecomplete_len211_score26_33_NODE_1354_length_1666_cov_105_838967_g1265_i09241556